MTSMYIVVYDRFAVFWPFYQGKRCGNGFVESTDGFLVRWLWVHLYLIWPRNGRLDTVRWMECGLFRT